MKKLNKGLLVSLEGIDGSGKSVLAKNLVQALKEYPTISTKEPGGTPVGEKIRAILLDKNSHLCPKAEFLLFAASRAEHFAKLVIPELQKGSLVISDRMADSSLVYQGYARGLDKEVIQSINCWAMNNVLPDLTFYVKVNVETALERIKKRNIPLTGFEQEKAFIEKTIEGFETIFSTRSNVIILDGTQPETVVAQQAFSSLQNLLS